MSESITHNDRKAAALLRIIPFLCLGIFFLLSFSCSHKDSNRIVCEITEPLDSLLGTVFSAPDAPGAFVTVMRGDSVVYAHGFGLARLDTRAPMTDTTRFNICSASKLFVTAGVMKLVEQHRLGLDDTLSEFFPQLDKNVFGKITIRHILTHSTGLPDLRPRNEKEWMKYADRFPSTQFAFFSDYLLYAKGEELTRFFEKLDTLAYEPGSRYEYMNPTYVLLSQIIEKVTAENFDSWLHENVIKSTGITTAEFYNKSHENLYSHGYIPAEDGKSGNYSTSGGKWTEYDYGEAPFFATKADQGLMITPADFRKWIRALCSGRIISQASLDTVNTVYISTHLSNSNIHYGLATFIQTRPGMPVKVFHSTANGGYSIFECRFPDPDLSYMIFSNRSDWNRLEVARKTDSILAAHGWLTGPTHEKN